ncbi:hypothetical protein M0804_013404 [Polistes exclamans]|nr:hypothetical protein M0804_013404 [Polistes exclamans]
MDQALQEDLENFGLRLLEKFNPETMEFLQWQNLLEFTIDLLDIVHKNFFLLNMLDEAPLTYISINVNPTNPFELPYEMLISMLEEKYSPHGVYLSTYIRLCSRVQVLATVKVLSVMAIRLLYFSTVMLDLM